MTKRFLIEVEGTKGTFSQNVSSSASPTEIFHLTNKEYVDSRDLESLSDISFLNLSDKDLLIYDNDSNSWKNSPPPSQATPSGSILPETASDGTFFYNTANEKLYFYFNGWQEVSTNTLNEFDGGNSSTTEFAFAIDGGNSFDTQFEPIYDGGFSL